MSIDYQKLLEVSLVSTENVECSTIIKKKDHSIKAKSAGYEVHLKYDFLCCEFITHYSSSCN